PTLRAGNESPSAHAPGALPDLDRLHHDKGRHPNKLTPARVRRGFRHLHAKAPTPATVPKPSQPGPGRPPGSKNRRPANRYDVGLLLATGEPYRRPAHHKVGTKPRRTG
ncbi:hypothetical protein ACIQVK_46500, partial [Streptomyces sp. NPDC090493]